jgi:hypothetical protein
LGFKHATHYVLGLDSQWSEYWNTDVQLFYKAFSDMIHTDAELRYANKGTGYARGFELFLRRNLTSKLFGWVSYTYARSRLRSDPKTSEVFSLYDQTHMLSVVGDYKLSATLACGGRLQYNTGTPYTPVEEGIYQTAFDKYQPRFRQDKLFSERLPPLTKMSAYVSMDSLYNEWKLKWRLGVEDLILGTDARNVRYNYDYSETKYVRSIPAIPYVEVRAVL